jgi:PTS system ascorbate-specific IIC component
MIIELGLNIIQNSFLLVAFYVAIGCMIQKKPIEKTLSSIVKSAISVYMINIGGGVVGQALASLTYLFQRSFQLIGIIANNERLVAYTEVKFGHIIYSLMIVGMLINLLIAKKTRFKYIFLTGHQTLYMSCVLTIILTYVGLNTILIIGVGGLLLGIMMSTFPALIQSYTVQITQKDNIAVGHFSSLGFYMSAKLGTLLGCLIKKKPSEENKKEKLNPLLIDNILATALSMILLFIITSLIAGKNYAEEVTIGTHYLVSAIKQGLIFSTGVYIILSGVRILIQELIPAFRGIADRFVPDAIPALDCSILFPYQQGIFILGFFGSIIGGILAMFVAGNYSLYVIIPSSTLCFFSGSASGLYGYVNGGKLGSIASSLLFGFILGILPLLLLPELKTLGFYKVALGEFDFTLVAMLIKYLFKLVFAVLP